MTLRVGIASYEEMKSHTMSIARGERRTAAGDPKVWFTSVEAFAEALLAGDPELFRAMADGERLNARS